MSNRGRGKRSSKTWTNVGLAALAVATASFCGVAVVHANTPPKASAPLPTFTADSTPSQAVGVTAPVVAALQAAAADGRTPVVSALGSSLTAGAGATSYERTWVWREVLALRDVTGADVQVQAHTYPGTPLPEIVDRGAVDAILADKPDVVFVETSEPNNRGQGVTPAEAERLTKKLLAKMRTGAPNAVVVGMTGSAVVDPGAGPGGATEADYVSADRSAFKSAGVISCDIHAAFAKADDLGSLLKDGVHPNDAGNALWATTLDECVRAAVSQ